MNKPHLEFQYMMRELIHHPAQLAGILDKKPILDRAPFLAVLRHWQEVGEPNQEDWRAMCERDDLQEIRQRICSDLDGLASYFGVDKSLLANAVITHAANDSENQHQQKEPNETTDARNN